MNSTLSKSNARPHHFLWRWIDTLFEVFSNCGRIILLKPPRLVIYQIRGPKLCTIDFWVRGIYLLYYLGIFLFLILPNSVYHYYWLSKYKITHKENSIYIYCAYSHNFENSINTQPLSYIYDFTYRKYSILYCSGIYSNYSMHLPNNKFMYTSMYLSLLSTSSITKASVNPFWQSFFLIRVMQIVFVSR